MSFFRAIVQEHSFVTCMGRRVKLRPFDATVEKTVMEIQSSRDPVGAFNNMLSSVLQTHVKRQDGSALPAGDLTLVEQQDILIYLRWVSNHRYVWRDNCSACKQEVMFGLDLQNLTRLPMLCSNASCACHEIAEGIEAGDNALMWKQEAWAEIPEEHLLHAPADLVWTAAKEEDLNNKELYGDLQVGFRLPLMSESRKFSGTGTSAIADQLSASIEWVCGTDESGKKDTRSMNLSERRIAIKRFINDPNMPQDLRGSLMTFLKRQRVGVSTSFSSTCDKCGHTKKENLVLGADFFLILKLGGPSSHRTR